jgi:hypothetical protein
LKTRQSGGKASTSDIGTSRKALHTRGFSITKLCAGNEALSPGIGIKTVSTTTNSG